MQSDQTLTTDNLRHWSQLERTDPSHTKPFDRGRFKGTATKPIWNERRLTEHFGPCGIGWGMDKPEFVLVPAGNELAVFCTVSLWYRDGEATGIVYGVGGDKVSRAEKNGPFVSDEAYKGAYTDALGNAMKHLGVNADIHMGMFDDREYVRELREEFASEQGSVAAPPPVQTQAQPKLSELRDRIKKAIAVADIPERVDGIIKANGQDLALIKAASEKTYQDIMAAAASHKTMLMVRAQPPHDPATGELSP